MVGVGAAKRASCQSAVVQLGLNGRGRTGVRSLPLTLLTKVTGKHSSHLSYRTLLHDMEMWLLARET